MTTWSGRDADATEDVAAEGGVVTGDVVPGAGGDVPDEQATAATAQIVRYTAATTRTCTSFASRSTGAAGRTRSTSPPPGRREWLRRRTDVPRAVAEFLVRMPVPLHRERQMYHD